MSFMKPTTQQPTAITDYLKMDFEVLVKDIHPINQIELHKQTGEMVYSTLTIEAIVAHQLQNSLNNISVQFQLEKASSQTKDTRIKSLEDLIIELGNDTKDVKVVEKLIKNKNDDIATLKKQLNIPPPHHPQTTEVLETQKEEELIELVLKLNDQLKETEKELYRLIQSKQNELNTTPQNVIPTVSTAVPSTLAASLAPIVPPATTMPVTDTSTSTGTSTEKTTELLKAMEEVTIQATELKMHKEKASSLETDCKLAQIQWKEEAQKSQRMGERIKILEKDLTLQQPLGDIEENLQANIIDSINDVWPSIQVSFQQAELVNVATEAIHKTGEELRENPQEANQLITLLSNKNMYQLDELGIEDRTGNIIEIKKILTKRNVMLNLEKECQSIQADIDRFMTKFGILRQKGLPSPMVIHEKLTTQDDYVQTLNKLASNQASTSGVKALPTGKVLYDILENLFFLEHEVKTLFFKKISFYRYTEADETYRNMIKMKLPKDEWWMKLTYLL